MDTKAWLHAPGPVDHHMPATSAKLAASIHWHHGTSLVTTQVSVPLDCQHHNHMLADISALRSTQELPAITWQIVSPSSPHFTWPPHNRHQQADNKLSTCTQFCRCCHHALLCRGDVKSHMECCVGWWSASTSTTSRHCSSTTASKTRLQHSSWQHRPSNCLCSNSCMHSSNKISTYSSSWW